MTFTQIYRRSDNIDEKPTSVQKTISILMSLSLMLATLIIGALSPSLSEGRSSVPGVVHADAATCAAYVGDTPYDTFAEAVSAANNSAEDAVLKLNADTAASFTVANTAGKTVTLDLNGHILTGVKSNNLLVKSPLVITDSKIDDGTGKYTTEFENTINNYCEGSVNANITIENAVVENTCTSCNTATIVYWPGLTGNVLITGTKTIIIYDSEYCKLIGNTFGLTVTGGIFTSDPTAYINTAEYKADKITAGDGSVTYVISVRPPVYYWKDFFNSDDVTVDGNIYTVNSAAGLAYIANLVNGGTNSFKGKTVVLAADIDLSEGGRYWNPIGSGTLKFEGVFDGGGHIISNLNVPGGNGCTGLFGSAAGDPDKGSRTTIKNFILENVYVNGSASTAAVVGNLFVGEVLNVTVRGDITVIGARYTGVICGQAYGNFTSCKVEGKEGSVIDCGNGKNGYFAGGIVGHWSIGSMTDCHVSGIDIHADWGVGGLVGVSSGSEGRMTVSYSTCEKTRLISTGVYGHTYFGGLLGQAEFTDAEKSYVKDIVLPDNTQNTGYIAGYAEACTGSDICYMNIETENANIGNVNSVIEGQSQAAARTSADNPYGVAYYIGRAGESDSEEYYLPFDQLMSGEEEQIVVTGYVDEFLTEPITVGKTITVNFGQYYSPAVTYITPAEGYEVNVAQDNDGNTVLTVEETDFTATFVDRLGNTVGTDTFNISDMNVTEPDVPAYGGFLAAWEDYELTLADITIHPVYNTDVFLVCSELTDCVFNGASTANRGEVYSAALAPVCADYNIPFGVCIKVGGTVLDKSGYTYNATTGQLTVNAEAVTGEIEITATAQPSTLSIVTWTQYSEQAYYIVNGEGDVYNTLTTEHETGTDITFSVALFSAYNKSAVKVYCNGTELAANEDGTYTIPNVNGVNEITLGGISENSPETGGVGKIDFIEKLLLMFAKFFFMIKGLFGIK